MVRQHLRLLLRHRGEALAQHVEEARVVVVARAPRQRLVGGVQDERVLEGVRQVRRPPPLEEQARALEPLDLLPQLVLLRKETARSTSWSNSRPSRAASCASAFVLGGSWSSRAWSS